MIQFNLLPDVKLEYIKARRSKRLVMLGSLVTSGVALALLVILFFGVNVLQKQHLSHLQGDIDRDSKKLGEIENLDKILTVQNQLGVLNDLHAKKPVASRMSTYIPQITPKDITISSLDVDFTSNTMAINGGGTSLSEINKFVDTLKFANYAAGDQTGKPFSSVVLASFGLNPQAAGTTRATYQISLSFDPIIFDSAHNVAVQVPAGVTTRSITEKPDSIFQQQDTQEEGGTQ
jgi:hypothetical protein